jgi:MFS family permease
VVAEIQVAVFFSCATLSGSFGGLIAFGIDSRLSFEKTGRAPWSWLFLIEGVIAIFIGIIAFFLLPRVPDDLQRRGKKHWLFTKEEIDLATTRFACMYCPAFRDHRGVNKLTSIQLGRRKY